MESLVEQATPRRFDSIWLNLRCAGFVHILPDAAGDLSNPCLGLSTEFPWAFVFAGSSLLFTFMGEYFLRLFIRR